MSRTFASFGYYNYRLWFASNLTAATATWMQRVAQDWIVLTVLTAHSGTAVGFVTSLQFLPQVVFSMYSGTLADRVNRRVLVQFTQAVIAACSVAMGVLVLTGSARLWHMCVLAFLAGTANTLGMPARQTFVSELVEPKHLPNAVGLNSTAWNAARLIGPGIAGLGVAVFGAGWVFIVNAGLFVLPIVLLVLVRSRELFEVPAVRRHRGMVREGLRYVRGRSDLMLIIVVATVISAFSLNNQLTQAVMATQVFHRGAGQYGLLGSVMAIGSLAGALGAARRTRPRVALVLAAGMLMGIFECASAVAPSYRLYALALIPQGFFMLTLITGANAAIQVSTDQEVRGRVLSIYFLFYLGVTPLGAPFIGWIAEHAGARTSVLVGGLAAVIVTAGAAIWGARAWRVRFAQTRRFPWIALVGPRERARSEQRSLYVHRLVAGEDVPVMGVRAATAAARELGVRISHPYYWKRRLRYEADLHLPRLRRGARPAGGASG